MRIYRSLGELQRYVDSGEMMSRTFYVDAENGDDNNDGSEFAPFATIRKACDSVPVGGFGRINLADGQIFNIDTDFYLINKYIEIIGSGNNKPIINFKAYLINSKNALKSIILSNSNLSFYLCNLRHDNKVDSSQSWTLGSGNCVPIVIGGVYSRHFDKGGVAFIECDISQTHQIFVLSKHSFGTLLTVGGNINLDGDSTAFVTAQYGTLSLNVYNTSITSGKKWVYNGTIGSNVITNLSSLDT